MLSLTHQLSLALSLSLSLLSDSRHWLQDCKFSPDGRAFAVASMDHKIYVYSRETYRLKGTCDRHNSYVKNFDFSEDSVYIQSDSGDYEHLYFEAEDGEYFASGSQLKNIRWSEWTCTYGWPVQGALFTESRHCRHHRHRYRHRLHQISPTPHPPTPSSLSRYLAIL